MTEATTSDDVAPRPVRMAKASWVCPLLIIGANMVLRPLYRDATDPRLLSMIFAVMVTILATAGFCLGVGALTGLRTHGRKGILIPAIIGILMNSFYLAVFVAAMVSSWTSRS